MDNRMKNAVNEFLMIQEELDRNYNIIDVRPSSSRGNNPHVQVSGKESLLKIADGKRVTVFDRKDSEYPYSLLFEDVENKITYETLLTAEEHVKYVMTKKKDLSK